MFQSISDQLLKKCPKCKKSKLRRLFGTGAAIVFKGSGFYQTDYRSDSYKKAARADAANGESKSSKVRLGQLVELATPKSEGSSGDKPSKSSKSSEK